MRINSLVLYRADGLRRSIMFGPGLNVITGESGTGKTSIINILRFLLGSGSPHAPIGPILDNVAWYGLAAQVGSTPFFIGRPAPPHGAETSLAMFRIGLLSAPEFAELAVDTNSEEIRAVIGGLLGIEDNLNVPEQGRTRRPLAASFVHSLYYCFQGQGEIANPDILFHRQNRDWQSQTIRDTLPYFLGAQGADDLRKREVLTQARRDLRRATTVLSGAESERESGLGAAAALVGEARSAGLLMDGDMPGSLSDARVILGDILRHEEQPRELEHGQSAIEELLSERADLRSRLRLLSVEIRGLDDFALADDEYANELNEHRVRLASIGLVPESGLPELTQCPLCSSELGQASSEARATINRSLGRVTSRLDYVVRDRPLIQGARRRIDTERRAIQNRLGQLEGTIKSIAESEEIREFDDERFHLQSFVKGRIAQFLESTSLTEDSELEGMRREVERLDDLIERLLGELDPEALRSRVTSILNVVGRRLTDHARTLGLEHSEAGARIDPFRLTIVADTPQGPAYMDTGEIGSGMNWVGYHLSAYLALQEYFISQRRPVPHFLVIDQPSQAFFPRDRERGGELDELSDADRENTRRLYRLMFDVAGSLSGKLQIIALDHAEFPDDEWFMESIVQRWRSGDALIPPEWDHER